ncbi:MAG: SelB C-terminal domain-containing protein, partial [Aquificaceae bacterium]|nr:SelB C-terminal domain-containing protein [Aquificaceae bacterium]
AFFGMREVSFSYRHIHEDVYLIKLSERVPAVRGDRGPVLSSSGDLVGAYEVLHPFPFKSSKRFIRSNLMLLLENSSEYLLLEKALEGLSLGELLSFYGGAVATPQVQRVGDRFYHPTSLELLSQRIRDFLNQRGGMLPISELKSKLNIGEELLKFLLERLEEAKVVEGYLLDIRKANPEELEGYRELLSLLGGGIKEERELEPYGEYLRMAIRRGQVYSLGDYLYLSKTLFEDYVNKLRALGKEFGLQQAKELLGLTRKYLVPLLEHMDRLGITKREGERRVFLK